MVGTGKGATGGVLFRSAEALETAGRLDTIVLDKTGTITAGHPVLTDVSPLGGHRSDDVLAMAAAAETDSEHPLASALVAGARGRNIPIPKAPSFESITGQGVRAAVNGHVVLVGNGALVSGAHVAFDVAIEAADVTLMSGSLAGVETMIRLSRATMRNIRQNLALAFGYNTLGIPIAAGVLYPFFGIVLSPVLAAAAMALSSLSVVSNANRLRRAHVSRATARSPSVRIAPGTG